MFSFSFLHQLARIVCACVLFGTAFAAAAFDFLLAEKYRAGQVDLADYYVSEKLDGVRAYWDGEKLLSRGGNIFAAPDWFLAKLPRVALDGELWGGRNTFAKTSGIVRRAKPHQGWRRVRFMVFDMPDARGDFSARLTGMQHLEAIFGNSAWGVVAQQPAPRDSDALYAMLAQIVSAGGEGLMLRRKDSHYRGGRHGDLIKLKSFDDAEAIVVAHHPGNGKYRDMLGSIEVLNDNGMRFKIGGGFSDAERRQPPQIGAVVTYRHNGFTENGKPRFPIFLRVRDDAPQTLRE